MSTIPVVVKHAGKKYDIELDTTSTGEVFKYQLFSLTGVEPDRQKILVKGGQLKDETELATLNFKPNQTILMMGTPSANVPKAPAQKTVFIEDMTEEQRAQQKGATPAGLQNLGNTCYMNSTLQTLRFVPELQQELQKYTAGAAGGAAGPTSTLFPELASMMAGAAGGGAGDLTQALRDLYKQMGSTTEGFAPLMFLQALRGAFPQFAERTRNGHFQQQDAEECYSQIITRLRTSLKIKDGAEASGSATTSFVDKFFAVKLATTVACDEDTPDEPAAESTDTVLKLDCHITVNTNFLRDGILAGLTEKLEKTSPSLGREAVYTKTSRVTRLPKYLTCHFVRFYWKREINKKAKIMRKVTFPFELDATEFCADELKQKLIPVRDKIRDLRKDVMDRARAAKRQKRSNNNAGKAESASSDAAATSSSTTAPSATDEAAAATAATALGPPLDWDKELAGLVDPSLAADGGQNVTGLYELLAVITHQGASADSGHYCAYVRKRGGDGKTWYFFNDDRGSEVPDEKVEQLAGGGESHSALICLYQAVGVEKPVVEEEA